MELGAAACQASALARGSGSPQKRLQRRSGKASGSSVLRFLIWATMLGTENQTVRRLRWMKRAGASSSMDDMANRQAPFSQHRNWSCTERSNVWSKVCEKRSSGVMP